MRLRGLDLDGKAPSLSTQPQISAVWSHAQGKRQIAAVASANRSQHLGIATLPHPDEKLFRHITPQPAMKACHTEEMQESFRAFAA